MKIDKPSAVNRLFSRLRPGEQQPRELQGYLDTIGMRRLRGWAAYRHGEAPNLTAWINGTAVAHFRPSTIRADINHLPRNDVGFDIDLGRALNPGDLVAVTDERGEQLARSPRRAASLEWPREEKALCSISRDMKILEIGPAYNPLTPRSQGWNSFSLDHATQEELRKKYAGQQPIERIEPVDFVWHGGPIETALPLPERNTFDALIASHVLEHIPDPIAFFLSATAILKPGGIITLVIPDKRFTFDFFKPLTATSDYLYARELRRTRHTKKTAFDYIACNVVENGRIAWDTQLVGNFNTFGDDALFTAKQRFDETVEDETGDYVDYHATIYTPSSFALIMFELGQLGTLPFTVERSFPTAGCEFFITLRNEAPTRLMHASVREERIRLMKAVVRELSQQARWLMDDAV